MKGLEYFLDAAAEVAAARPEAWFVIVGGAPGTISPTRSSCVSRPPS